MAVEGEPLTAEGKYPFSTPDFLAALAARHATLRARPQPAFSAESRLADMDEQGVDVQVLYPTVGGQLLGREFHDTELLAACCRAYNDWSAEYCRAAPERLRWAAMLPLQDVDAGHRRGAPCRRRRCGRVLRPPEPAQRAEPLPSRLRSRSGRRSRRLDRPLCIHDSGSPHLPSFGERMDTHTTGHILAHPFEAMAAMIGLIWYGVFEHFPRLTVVHVEADAGWVPYLLQRMEQHWEFSGNAEHPDLKMRPTEYFRRNVFVACRGDERTLPSVVELAATTTSSSTPTTRIPTAPCRGASSGSRRSRSRRRASRRYSGDNAARAFRLGA